MTFSGVFLFNGVQRSSWLKFKRGDLEWDVGFGEQAVSASEDGCGYVLCFLVWLNYSFTITGGKGLAISSENPGK